MKYPIKRTLLSIVTSLIFLAVSTAVAASDIRTERVHFKKGTSSAVVEDSIEGYATRPIPGNSGRLKNPT